MTKIPVGRTIAHAYRFTFENFPRVIGVVWLPWALMVAGTFLVRGPMAAFNQATGTRDFAVMQGQWTPLLLFYGLSVVLLFMQVNGLTRLALGLPNRSPYFYFSLGKPVWRLIGAVLLALLVMMVITIVYILAGLLLGFIGRTLLAAHPSTGAAMAALLLAVIFVVAGYAGFIFMMVRFLFVLAPVVVAEEEIGLARAWTLTNGNFWRVFLVILAVLVPFLVLEIGGFILLTGPVPLMPHGSTPVQIAAFRQANQAWEASSMARTQKYSFIIYPIVGILSAVLYSLSAAAQCFAYRALSEDETLSPVAGD